MHTCISKSISRCSKYDDISSASLLYFYCFFADILSLQHHHIYYTMSEKVPLEPKRMFEVIEDCSACPNQVKVIKKPFYLKHEGKQATIHQIIAKYPYVLMHRGINASLYIQMFPFTILASDSDSVNIVFMPFQD